MNFRPIRWPADATQLQKFDTSYCTTTIFVPEVAGLSMSLREVGLTSPFEKTYAPESIIEAIAARWRLLAASGVSLEQAALEIGVAVVELRAW